MFNLEDWRVIGEYVYDSEGGRHQAFYSPIRDIHYKDIHFKAGERVQVEQSLKYSQKEIHELWERSGLNEVKRWSASSDSYSMSKSCFLNCFFCSADHATVGKTKNEALSDRLEPGPAIA